MFGHVQGLQCWKTEREAWEGNFRLTKFPSVEGIMSGSSSPEVVANISVVKCIYFSSENVSVGAFYLALSELRLKKNTRKLDFNPSKTDEISREGLL